MRIIAVDPGETCGWAIWERNEGSATIIYGQTPVDQFIDDIHDFEAAGRGFDIYVCELFKVRPKITPSYITLEAIGAIAHLARRNLARFEGQTPSQGKRVSDEVLIEADMYITGSRHANDALRHLYLRLAIEKLI